LSKRLLAGNHEDHVVRHETEHRLKITAPAGGEPSVDHPANGALIVGLRGCLACVSFDSKS
jgi:hypothetical protein